MSATELTQTIQAIVSGGVGAYVLIVASAVLAYYIGARGHSSRRAWR